MVTARTIITMVYPGGGARRVRQPSFRFMLLCAAREEGADT